MCRRKLPKWLRTLGKLLPVLFCPVLLTSCLHPVQLNQRAIVQAVGVDLSDTGEILLSLQIFSPASGGGGNISAAADNAKIIESRGATVSEAIQNAVLVQGKQLFMGHNRVIILGSSLARQSIGGILACFSASPSSRQNVQLAMAEDTAADILKARINQGMLPAETLEKILENAQAHGLVKSVKLYEFLSALESPYQSGVLPVMRLEKAAGEDGENEAEKEGLDAVSGVSVTGTAVFREGQLAGILGPEESRGLLWIRDEMEQTMLTLSTEAYETAGLRIFKAESHLTPIVEGERITFLLRVHCQAALEESRLRPGHDGGEEDIAGLSEAAGQWIAAACEAAFHEAAQVCQGDVFHLGSLLWQADPKRWSTLQEDWQSRLDTLSLRAEATLDLNRIGLRVEQQDSVQTGL